MNQLKTETLVEHIWSKSEYVDTEYIVFTYRFYAATLTFQNFNAPSEVIVIDTSYDFKLLPINSVTADRFAAHQSLMESFRGSFEILKGTSVCPSALSHGLNIIEIAKMLDQFIKQAETLTEKTIKELSTQS